MKMMICGKGGSGKTTLTAMIAKTLASQGRKVLVIDCDESNYGIDQMLGMELPETYINYFGGKMAILGQMFANHGAENVHDLFDKDLAISDIPEKYISTKGNISLMSPGKLQAANEAAACPFNVVMIRFLPHLKLKPDEVVLMDMEAGIEHFARGTDDSTDAVVMVVDPTYESIALSRKITEIAGEIGKPVYYILNKMDDEVLPKVEEGIPDRSRVVGIVHEDEVLEEDALDGKEVDADSDVIRGIVAKLPFRRMQFRAYSP